LTPFHSNRRRPVPCGFEQPPVSPQKTAISETGGAESGAVDAEDTSIDLDLQVIIQRWLELPEAVKAGILAMIRAAE